MSKVPRIECLFVGRATPVPQPGIGENKMPDNQIALRIRITQEDLNLFSEGGQWLRMPDEDAKVMALAILKELEK